MDAAIRDALQRAMGPGYRLERELGGGGMSRVFVARDLSLDRDVVIKVLPSESTGEVSADRFRREIQVIARLQHPHVVPILAAGSADGSLYYVMPFVGGETLRARMSREGPMSVAATTRVLREVLDALAFAHSHGVIHRDIKPENVLLEAGHAVVADFGVAKALRESGSLTSAGFALGTPAYMSPEQATADPAADHRTDLYATGVLAYELLTGSPPFSGTPSQLVAAHITETPTEIRQRRSDVPEPLAVLIMRALAKEPADRPQSAQEMLESLDTIVTPSSMSTSPLFSPKPRRSQRNIIAAVAAVLVIAIGAGAWKMSRPVVITSAESMAIAPFVAADGDSTLTRLGQNLVTTISANLDGVGQIRVADPVAMLRQATTVGHPLSAAEAGIAARTLGAQSVVHGTLTRVGPNVRADLSLYRVDSTSSPLVRLSVITSPDSIVMLSDSLTWALLRSVWQRGKAPTPTFETVRTRSFAALREFLDGEQKFAGEDMPGAIESYKRAIAADSNFWFAMYRLRLTQQWIALPTDTAMYHRLLAHVGDLSTRDREFILADTGRSVMSRTERLAEFLKRYPAYAPAWQLYGDHLIHQDPHQGVEVRDAIAPLQRAAALMPNDFDLIDHLIYACSLAGDKECARKNYARYDSLVRTGKNVAASPRFNHRAFFVATHELTAARVDSLVDAMMRDSVLLLPYASTMQFTQGFLDDRPALQQDMDRIAERVHEKDASVVRPLDGLLVRGKWSDAINGGFKEEYASGKPSPEHLLAYLRWRVMGEATGAIAPSVGTADTMRALMQQPKASAALFRRGQWVIGVNAIVRRDEAMLKDAEVALAKDTTDQAKRELRSLRALEIGFAGNHKIAADSLIATDWGRVNEATPDAAATALDRLFASRWLQESGKAQTADSLIRYVSSFYFSTNFQAAYFATLPLALLERSRIAETLGNREDAVRYARRFVTIYDSPPPAHKPLVAEARDRIARLSATDARQKR